MFNKKLLLTPLVLFCLAGCSFKPVTPLKDTSYTSTYNEANINAFWWKEFNDPVLDDLIASALKYNSDLALALNNIETARANLGLSKIEYLPNVNYQGKASRGTPSGDLNSYASYSANAVLNYELDLWGKVRNSVKAKNSLFKATKYDYEAARLSIASSVANSYFKLLFLKEQESVLRDTLKSYEDTFKFRQNQFSVGAISSIALYQAKTQVDSAKVKLTNVINELSSTNTALAILTGKSYDEILYKDIITDKAHQPTPPEVPNGVPSDLLLRRADVAASLERLKATNFLVGVARANYFPSFSLTGMFGYTSMEFDRLFIENANSWSAGGSLVGPLLDFGRSAKRVEIANLEQNASFINYDKTLKEAFGEVRNALVGRENAISKQTDMANLLNSQEKLYNIANERFKTGYSDNLELLDAQRGYLSARLEYAASNLEVSNSVVEVFKALGGGFKVEDNKTKQMLESNATIIPTSSVNPFKDLN
ncbi:TolC family protein [Campylobacter ureolyticus]|uniref:Multidrug efflux system CmeABC, outer membrane lipoprotein CmeC n=1 Tax=Campylobacter ureolyticus TaxID=827 RepID=A0AAE7EBB4_9BACT|nr:TolC family protein [Campylobacter ureolyticus]MCR8685384.1 TolC family protein [Campylobacter ureolyticus]QKF85064.1 multidrug efflux system CmeABC, outer membrane lipoprotein CmeC [Campylobacter ureolyticus]QQY36444.1 TolC family protein [Campylobacter ureolyticus]SUX19793.1 RND efflux system, outer membrane lipoprotein CmeC [Campylobacter ureolyticus]